MIIIPNTKENAMVTNAVTYTPQILYTVGVKPYAVSVGDFNNDNYEDLAVANLGDNSVSILFGNGRGGFSTPSNFNVGKSPYYIISGDFNNDGNIDLKTTNSGDNTASVLLGNGLGGFTIQTNTVTGYMPWHWVNVSSDVNNDGYLDVIQSINAKLVSGSWQSNNTVSVQLNDGNGNFLQPTDFIVGTRPASVGVADLNGDSFADLITTNNESQNISVLIGNGAGGFSNQNVFAVGRNSTSVSISDINGDNILDLAVANQSDSTVSVLLGDGAGGFSPQSTFPVGKTAYSVTIGDFNNDGKADLVTANPFDNSISVLLNTTVMGNLTYTSTGYVSIKGKSEVGQTLLALNNVQDLYGVVKMSYQWLRNGLPISNQNKQSYTLSLDDFNQKISVDVNYTDGLGNYKKVITPDPMVYISQNSIASTLSISSAGSYNAGTGNVKFNFAAGNYNYTITNFGIGDVLNFPSGAAATIINKSTTDNLIEVQWALSGNVATINLLGLTPHQDSSIFSSASFNSVFGVGAIADASSSTFELTPSSGAINSTSSLKTFISNNNVVPVSVMTGGETFTSIKNSLNQTVTLWFMNPGGQMQYEDIAAGTQHTRESAQAGHAWEIKTKDGKVVGSFFGIAQSVNITDSGTQVIYDESSQVKFINQLRSRYNLLYIRIIPRSLVLLHKHQILAKLAFLLKYLR